jgi:hypothetical protein
MSLADEAYVRTHATFLGAEPYGRDEEDGDEEPMGAGAGVLEHIANRLRKDGLEVDELVHEDRGARIEVESGGEVFRIGIDHRGDDFHLWVCAPEGAAGVLTVGLDLRTVMIRIDQTLKKLSSLRRITWHLRSDWEIGDERNGRSKPVPDASGPILKARFRQTA